MVGWNTIVLNTSANQQGPTLTFLRPGLIRLNFGAIGKGIAAQAALEILRTLGTTVAMSSLTGDIACGDVPAGSDGWVINVKSGIEGVPSCRLIQRNQCVSTSGNESQHLDANGIRYSHVVDPRTGWLRSHSTHCSNGCLSQWSSRLGTCNRALRGRTITACALI
jgi:thiamine biosynthesis lipoprotein ApbE